VTGTVVGEAEGDRASGTLTSLKGERRRSWLQQELQEEASARRADGGEHDTTVVTWAYGRSSCMSA
jgi:hypothetical protein